MLKLNKRGVQIGLGLAWLLDGLLQLQHPMFTKAFVTQVIDPAMVGQPGFVRGPMHLGAQIFLSSPVLFNSLFALTQLFIAGLILYPRSLKVGLNLSILWGLVVWIFGEGYGGIFSGHSLLLMGAPGAVIIYVILALAAMPKTSRQKGVAYWLALVWMVIWVAGGVLQLLPGQNSTSQLSTMISANAEGAPSWLASLDNHTAKYVYKLASKNNTSSQGSSNMGMSSAQMMHMTSEPAYKANNKGYIFILMFALAQFYVGFGVLFKGLCRKLAIALGIVMAIFFWFVGQNLGGYYTGFATDLNTGPLLILMALAILGCGDLDHKLKNLGQSIERLMTGKQVDNQKIIKTSK